MSSILCLDLGTKTGYCFGHGEGNAVSGTADFKPQRFEGGGMRFVRFRKWLTEIHASTAFTAVYFEEVRGHKGVDAAHIYGGLMAHLTEWCESKGVPYSGIPVGTIKKFGTGKGNSGKEAMIAATRAWGYDPEDDNAADAIVLYHYVQAQELAQ